MNKRFNIAYLVAHKSVGYPIGIQNGVKKAVEEQGHNLINIMDLLPSNDFLEWSHNYLQVAFQLAAHMDFDAYILPIGVANAFNSKSSQYFMRHYIELLDPKKTILIEEYYEGFRCIKKDNKPGMRQLMKHLLEKHGYRKICFISGPSTSFGARERESVYFDEMEKHGIKVEDRMFARGNFSGECDDVVEEMLSRNPDAEAIACASDHIAETVYRVMKHHGLTPGKDIAVTGFDDIDGASMMTPPLSTVRLSVYDMAYAAGYEAVRLCEGKPQEIFTFESEFIHRISCGETSTKKESKIIGLLSQRPFNYEELAKQMMEDVSVTAPMQVKKECLPRFQRFVDKAFDNYYDDKNQGHRHIVDQEDLIDIFRYDYIKFFSLIRFCDIVMDCYEIAASRSEGDKKIWLYGEQAYFQRIIGKNIEEQYRLNNWNRQKRQYYITRITMDALMYSMDPDNAVKAMLEDLLRLGVKDAAILSFLQPIEYINHSSLHLEDTLLLKASISDGKVTVYHKPKTYKLFETVKTFLAHESSQQTILMDEPNYTVGALLTGRDIIGVLVIGPNMMESSEIVKVYHQISVGMQHLKLIRNEQELIAVLNRNNLRLSRESECDELTGIFNRRGFLNNIEQHINGVLNGSETERRAAIFYMDLDGLKHINDTYGHDEGDFIIKSAADILDKAFENGFVGRLGGDEFLGCCIPDGTEFSEPDEMISRVEKMLKDFNLKSGKTYKLNISIGYRKFTVDSETMKKLPTYMEDADKMLYDNKRKHKELYIK